MRLFIFGIGFSSRAFIDEVKDRCDWIGGTTRSTEKAQALQSRGIAPFLFDGKTASDDMLCALREATHVLVSIAPSDEGDPVLKTCGSALQAGGFQWIGYLSTVGVYGNHNGAWVNEETPCQPVSRRSIQRVIAENSWLAFSEQTGMPVQVFRLSGIYGPGRNTFENFRKGTARRLVKPGQVFNRIRVEDIAGALSASLKAPKTRIYNVTDDLPAPPQDVVALAAELLGVAPPTEIAFETADLSPMARSFYGENKRVCNDRLKTELGYQLRFPDYKISLQNLLPKYL